MIRVLLMLSTLAFAGNKNLVGHWLKDGQPYAQFEADGTGRVDGDRVKWDTLMKLLVLTHTDGRVETMGFSISGDQLTVGSGGEMATFTRGTGKEKAAAKPAAAKAEGGAAGGGDLKKLLTSTAWCYFSYNKISGTTKQERVVFSGNGTWGSGARRETYSSGMYGTVAGQHDSGDGGRWQAQGSSLLMSQGGGPLEDVGLRVTRNSNGYPILNAGGKEYSSCN